MAMICFERADALHAHEAKIRSIEVRDAESLCAYLKGFWEFIYNHKMFGCVYDIYGDNIEVIRENGFVIKGIPAVKQELLNLCAAFPDLRVRIEEIFAMPKGDGYEVWMRYYFTGTNSAYSQYGPPTGLHLEDIRQLLEVLMRLRDKGSTIIVIEHNLDVIKMADYIIDIGPEGGDAGGRVIAKGTPEEIIKVKASHTGRYLKEILEKDL